MVEVLARNWGLVALRGVAAITLGVALLLFPEINPPAFLLLQSVESPPTPFTTAL